MKFWSRAYVSVAQLKKVIIGMRKKGTNPVETKLNKKDFYRKDMYDRK